MPKFNQSLQQLPFFFIIIITTTIIIIIANPENLKNKRPVKFL
jgi:hypothetical protein